VDHHLACKSGGKVVVVTIAPVLRKIREIDERGRENRKPPMMCPNLL
jgi:hypothetical protein